MTVGRIAVAGASVVALTFAVVGVAEAEREAFLVTASMAVALVALRRRERVGGAVTALAGANVAGWLLVAGVVNAAGRETFAAIAVPLGVGAVAAATALAGAAVALGAGRRPAVAMALAAMAVGGVLAAGLAAAGRGRPAPPVARGELEVTMKDTAFSPEDLVVPAGGVSVHVSNDDLFWHTFTVNDIDVDLRVPPGAVRRVRLAGPPGTYELVCAIPGHDAAGMNGRVRLE